MKTAALKEEVKLKPHQIALINRVINQDDKSILAAHATGSGKTLTGIAAFEKLKEKGFANKALVVVPASLRENFAENGIKKFTNSSVSIFGPKGEAKTKNIGDKSNSTYNIVSYDLFREHGDKLIETTGADTLIMDEIQKTRSDEGVTYNKIRDLRPKFKQAITLTGSVINNQPNDIVPLMDVTFRPDGHKLVSKDFFDKNFVNKETVVKGGWLFRDAKVDVQKNIKNKDVLAKYLKGKIDYIGHEDVEKDLPKKKVNEIEVEMSKEQNDMYHFSMATVDPLTRWKITNNIPVGQKEAQDAFGKLMQARQISTDPSILSKSLKERPVLEISPKIKRIVDDAHEHLNEDKNHKVIIYGNLIQGQLASIEKGLQEKGLDYTKFYGIGNEGSSAKARSENIKDYMSGKKRIILISGAGAEGLDLKGTTLMQMAEGHYNPERIHQAESRGRRINSGVDSITINRYISKPQNNLMGKFLDSTLGRIMGTNASGGVDKWIYTVAKRKDDLNKQVKEVLQKHASGLNVSSNLNGLNMPLRVLGGLGGAMLGAGIPMMARGTFLDHTKEESKRNALEKILKVAPQWGALTGLGIGAMTYPEILAKAEKIKHNSILSKLSDREKKLLQSDLSELSIKDMAERITTRDDFVSNMPDMPDPSEALMASQVGTLARSVGNYLSAPIARRADAKIEADMKQKLIDLGKENLIDKKHYNKILGMSGINQRAIDLANGAGVTGLGFGLLLPLLKNYAPENSIVKTISAPSDLIGKGLSYAIPSSMVKTKALTKALGGSVLLGLATPVLVEMAKGKIIRTMLANNASEHLQNVIGKYEQKLRDKAHRKYKGSKKYIQEYDTKQDLGLDVI